MDELRMRSLGAIFDTITHQLFKIVETVLLSVNVPKEYECTVNPIMERILNNLHEARTLASQRDGSLPRLVFLELRVKAIESSVE